MINKRIIGFLALSAALSETAFTQNSGTATSVPVTSANGVSGTVTNSTTPPAISLSLGSITPAAVNGLQLGVGGNLSAPASQNISNVAVGPPDVIGDRTEYEPGDVISIDDSDLGKFVKSDKVCSRMVAGVFSTKPGLVGRRATVAGIDKEAEVRWP